MFPTVTDTITTIATKILKPSTRPSAPSYMYPVIKETIVATIRIYKIKSSKHSLIILHIVLATLGIGLLSPYRYFLMLTSSIVLLIPRDRLDPSPAASAATPPYLFLSIITASLCYYPGGG